MGTPETWLKRSVSPPSAGTPTLLVCHAEYNVMFSQDENTGNLKYSIKNNFKLLGGPKAVLTRRGKWFLNEFIFLGKYLRHVEDPIFENWGRKDIV